MKVTADDRLFEEIPGLCIGIIAFVQPTTAD